jgi:3-hydroxyisobutyrate dehydrogenase
MSSGADGPQAETLGYLGLGMMGFPMARRLLNAGFEVSVWNRSGGKAAGLVETGARLASSPRDVASAASIIFICVTNAKSVEEVVFGTEGLAAVAGGGKTGRRLFLNPSRCSTRHRRTTEGRQRDAVD